MRNEIFIKDKGYTRQTLLIEMRLLEIAQKLANHHELSVSELINRILEKEFSHASL